MAVTYGFFNSVNGDRKYDADQMSEFYNGIVTEGVFQHVDNGLAVSAGTGMTVAVATGRAIIQNKWVKNDSPLTLDIGAASPVAERVDAVVLRFNSANRNVSIIVKTGGSEPPEMTRTGGIYEMALAYVNVQPGATTVSVGDKRSDSSVCGWASVAQATSGEVDQMLNDLKTGFDGTVYNTPAAEVRGSDQKIIDTLIKSVSITSPSIAGLIKPDGSYNYASGYTCTDYIEIPSGALSVSITGSIVTNRYISIVAFYSDNSGTVISTVQPAGSNISVEIPDGAKYIRTTSNTDTNSHTYDCSYAFKCVKGFDGIQDEFDDLSDDVLSIQRSTASFSAAAIATSFTHEHTYINASGDLQSISGSFAATDAISIPDDAIFISIRGSVTNTGGIQVAFYTDSTADHTSFIYGVKGRGQEYDLNIPDGAKYIRIGSNTNGSGVTFGTLDYSFTLNLCLRDKFKNLSNDMMLRTPSSYDLIVGDTLEIFYKGLIDGWDNEGFFVQADCSKGSNYKNRFIITPTEAGTLPLTLRLYDSFNTLKDTKTISLVTKATPTSPSSNKNILCVGDSLTVGGQWPAEMKRRLTASGGTPEGYNLSNITFIGTREDSGVNFEGYGGWTFNSYNTANVSANSKVITCTHDKTEAQDQHSIYKDAANNQWKLETIEAGSIKIMLVSGNAATFPATGTLTWLSGGLNHSDITYTASENAPGNPFWDSTENKVDFSTYAASVGASSIDYVFVLIGWNDAGTSISSIKTQAQTFINNVKASYPNAKIVLMGLQIPARDGLGVNYGATGTWSKYLSLVKFVHDLDDMYGELAEENANVSHVNISGQFDTEHNMPEGTRTVNTRNSETETYQTNGIHPAISGYYQIADAATRAYVGL